MRVNFFVKKRKNVINHEWFFLPDKFYLQYIRIFFPLFKKVIFYANTCATTIIGTRVERLNVCRTESVSMCPSPFGTELIKNEYKQNAKVNQLILFLIVTRRLKIICYTTKNVHLITTTTNFLFFLKQDLTSIYLS